MTARTPDANNTFIVQPGQYFRFSVRATVTDSPNTWGAIVSGDALGTQQPTNLGLAAFGGAFANSAKDVVMPRTSGNLLSTAVVNPNFSSAQRPGLVNPNTGEVGTGSNANNLITGILNAGSVNAASSNELVRLTTGTRGTPNDFLFTNLAYSMPASGLAVLTPSFPTTAMGFVAVSSNGNTTDTFPKYLTRGFDITDTLTGLPPITIKTSGFVPVILNLKASDAAGESGFASTTGWSTAGGADANRAPRPGDVASVVAGRTLRTPADAAVSTFAADSLALGNNNSVGTLVLNSADNGRVTISDLRLNNGTVRNGGSSTGGATNVTLAGSVRLDAGGGTLDSGDGARTLTVAGPVSSSGALTTAGDGLVVLTADNTYTGATNVNAGTLKLTGASASTNHVIAAGAVLELAPAAAVDYASTTFAGVGVLRKTGTARAQWGNAAAGFAMSPGALIDVREGTFVGGSSGNDDWTNNKADLNVAAGATFDGVEANVRVGRLTGGGTVTTGFAGAGYATFTVGVDDGSGTFAGVITDANAAGRLTKSGAGTQALTGTSTYTGGTAVNAGTLALGDGGTGGRLSTAGTISVAGGATFAVNRSDAVTQGTDFAAAPITGAGGLTQAGTGTLTLTAANAYAGPTLVSAGTLRAASAAAVQALLNTTSGVDLAAGAKLELAYTAGTSPLATVKSILAAGYAQTSKFGSGQLRSGTVNGRTIGYGDSGGVVTVRVTLAGDADLDGDVDFADFVALQSSFGQANTRFDQGNFDYDNDTDFADFVALQSNFGRSLTGARAAFSREERAAVMAITRFDQVPEPAALALVGLGAAALRRRTGRCAR